MKISEELQQLRLKSLTEYKASKIVEYVELLASRDSCDNCKALSGKKYKLTEAISLAPLPVHNCTHKKGFCRCTYLPVV